ncbi:LegC family aminotransferase [Prochlorococcus marinus]|uniref:Predicted pyridoxal phosphate-dependent enzyme n=1 Tax=Prochlorococcus marinus (strain MIT 9303) TaxID=59922 RepID=A2C5V7_PROM3|nr:LegC family aminotransferase [Prochlorococcus marinus]ABM76867.1 Predicted pyridoxal phosphate-dependent enzyme [Prochlorococcus marinus str. MIT 9303]
MKSLAIEIVNAIEKVIGPASKDNKISLHEPDFNKTNAWKYVKNCIDSGWVSSTGSWVNEFEKGIVNLTGAKYAVAVVNGTSALRLSLHVVGVKPNDEVIMSPLSFVATANSVSHLGAIPHFVDINRQTFALDATTLDLHLNKIAVRTNGGVINTMTGNRISAVVPVHVFGHAAEMEAIKSVTDYWGLALVEDAAEALGSWRNDIHCGLFGDMGIISFNGNKIITTGGGGMILTNNENRYQKARHLSTTAKIKHDWEFIHDAVAWNDRMPNINAALGLAQLEALELRLEAKRNLAKLYKESFSAIEEVEFIEEMENCISNNWLITVRLKMAGSTESDQIREQILSYAHKSGILLRPVWNLLNELPMYIDAPKGSLIVAEGEEKRLINLPSSPQLLK